MNHQIRATVKDEDGCDGSRPVLTDGDIENGRQQIRETHKKYGETSERTLYVKRDFEKCHR